MEIDTKLKLLCFICQSNLNFKGIYRYTAYTGIYTEICHKFQIYTKKFLNSSLFSQEKFEITRQSVTDSGDDAQSKNTIISCCVQCVAEVETFCEMWESLESLKGKMIRALVTISSLKNTNSSQDQKISQKSLPNCFICKAMPRPKSNYREYSQIDICLKFIKFVTRFVSNTEKPSFDQKTLEIFAEFGRLRTSVTVYCCDSCLTQLFAFCETYEAFDSLQLEILRSLDRISNKSSNKYFQSSVEIWRRQSFPRVKLERLPCLDKTLEQIQVQTENTMVKKEFPEVAELESEPKVENEHQADEDYFDSSNGIPTPSLSVNDNNNDDNADTSEAAPSQAVNIFKSDLVTMKTTECEIKRNLSKKQKQPTGCNYKGGCVFCRKEYTDVFQLANHIRAHTGEKGFICRICLQEYTYKRSLLLHRRTRHFREKNAPALKVCETCGKSYEKNSQLIRHVQTVHEKLRPHKGDIRGKKFNRKISLQRHQNDQAAHDKPERLYSCDTCEKTFQSYNSLQRHKRVVHEGRQPKPRSLKKEARACHLCGKTMSSRTKDLPKHLNVHHRSEIDDSLKIEKEFKCSIPNCQRAFYDNRDLQRHMLLKHTGEKKFQCDQCGKAFSFQCHLKRHKECHNEVQPYVCAHCGKGFKYKRSMTKHEKKIHTRDNVTLA